MKPPCPSSTSSATLATPKVMAALQCRLNDRLITPGAKDNGTPGMIRSCSWVLSFPKKMEKVAARLLETIRIFQEWRRDVGPTSLEPTFAPRP